MVSHGTAGHLILGDYLVETLPGNKDGVADMNQPTCINITTNCLCSGSPSWFKLAPANEETGRG